MHLTAATSLRAHNFRVPMILDLHDNLVFADAPYLSPRLEPHPEGWGVQVVILL